MIEEAMLAANVCAANFMNKHYKFGVYRIHEEPEELKLESLKNFFSIKGFSDSYKKIPLELINQCLSYAKEKKLNKVLQTMVLKKSRVFDKGGWAFWSSARKILSFYLPY